MLDHGILNVPLSKRGDIDKQLDIYKSELATNEKNRRKQFQEDKLKAKELWQQVNKEEIKRVAKLKGVKYSTLKNILDGYVKWEPSLAIKILPEYIKPCTN